MSTLSASQLQQLQQEFEQLPRPNLAYPAYYTVPFHAYDEGNLNWQVRYRHSVQGFVCNYMGCGVNGNMPGYQYSLVAQVVHASQQPLYSGRSIWGRRAMNMHVYDVLASLNQQPGLLSFSCVDPAAAISCTLLYCCVVPASTRSPAMAPTCRSSTHQQT